jgi:hypothetical protein
VPLQNRVTPTGEIVADPGRGLLTGNRGCLHTPDRRLGVARWRSKLWICCTLDWQGRRRDPMPPGRWTMLFFLDEATALAAGHRPCGYCRRGDYLAFGEAWRRGQGLDRRPRATELDAALHRERVEPRSRRQLTRPVPAEGLPDGVMVRSGDTVGLVVAGRLLPWSFDGYGRAVTLAGPVDLLTPPSTVAAIRSGYRPGTHPSAGLDPA